MHVARMEANAAAMAHLIQVHASCALLIEIDYFRNVTLFFRPSFIQMFFVRSCFAALKFRSTQC